MSDWVSFLLPRRLRCICMLFWWPICFHAILPILIRPPSLYQTKGHVKPCERCSSDGGEKSTINKCQHVKPSARAVFVFLCFCKAMKQRMEDQKYLMDKIVRTIRKRKLHESYTCDLWGRKYYWTFSNGKTIRDGTCLLDYRLCEKPKTQHVTGMLSRKRIRLYSARHDVLI